MYIIFHIATIKSHKYFSQMKKRECVDREAVWVSVKSILFHAGKICWQVVTHNQCNLASCQFSPQYTHPIHMSEHYKRLKDYTAQRWIIIYLLDSCLRDIHMCTWHAGMPLIQHSPWGPLTALISTWPWQSNTYMRRDVSVNVSPGPEQKQITDWLSLPM